MRSARPARTLVLRGLATALLAGAMLPDTSTAAEIPVDPGSFPVAFAAANPGDTLLLAGGDYGAFAGAMKAGEVVIRPQPGANASMALKFSPAANITIDGLRLTEVLLAGAQTKNIIVRNSTVAGQTTFRTGELANANVLFDRNVHPSWDKCDGCGEGRVFLPENTGQPSGITIQNSRFGPGGDSDGIQNGSNGTRILNNEFVSIKQIDDGRAHADAIQLYGSKNTLVRGNWFRDVSVGIMAPDGADHETIEDNVFQTRSAFSLQLGSDDGSVIRHNTFVYGACEYNKACGIISLGQKSGNAASRGTVITDNVLSEISYQGTVLAGESHNLFATVNGKGTNNLKGRPTYVGGANPTAYAGFALAPGSLGKGTASDGLDRGIRLDPAAAATLPPPFAIGSRPPAGNPGRIESRGPTVSVRSSLRSMAATGRVRLAVRSPSSGVVVLAASVRPGLAVKSYRGRHWRPLMRLRPATLRFAAAGTRTVTLGLKRRQRRVLGRSRSARVSVRTFTDVRRSQVSGSRTLTIRR